MKKTLPIMAVLIASKSFAAGDPQAAIDHLWSLPNATDERLEMPRNTKITLGDWIKFHASEPFKFRVVNNLPDFEGYRFIVDMVSCSTELLTPVGGSAGNEEKTVGFTPPVTQGQVAVWTQEKKGCVNSFACSYQVGIEGLNDPAAKRTFGPVGAVGGKGPLYDCFLEATDVPYVE